LTVSLIASKRDMGRRLGPIVRVSFVPTCRYGCSDRYFSFVTAAAQANMAQGFLLSDEAERVVREARKVRFSG
jgi:hypothetical protein